MEIMLGIFKSGAFKTLREQNKAIWEDYPFKSLGLTDDLSYSVINIVKMAASRAKKINFLLDDIKLPLSDARSLTCSELIVIMRNDEWLEKTQFWLECKPIDRYMIVNAIHSPEVFNYESFNDIFKFIKANNSWRLNQRNLLLD